MKGIILAGGHGTRLYPVTAAVNKHLLPLYDKPMIYYSLSSLMLAGLKEIALITRPDQLSLYQALLGDGSHLGLSISYIEQDHPRGLSEAFLLTEDFLAGDSACLVLGDNLFYGQGFSPLLSSARQRIETGNAGACVFAYHVESPKRYGVVEFDKQGMAISIEEKPEKPRSNYAVTGLYFYNSSVVERAKSLKPSARGELEITDLNVSYLADKNLSVEVIGRGIAWLDTGTHDSFLEASQYIAAVEKRQGLKIGCVEEIAYRKGFIDEHGLKRLIDSGRLGGDYKVYLSRLLEEERLR